MALLFRLRRRVDGRKQNPKYSISIVRQLLLFLSKNKRFRPLHGFESVFPNLDQDLY